MSHEEAASVGRDTVCQNRILLPVHHIGGVVLNKVLGDPLDEALRQEGDGKPRLASGHVAVVNGAVHNETLMRVFRKDRSLLNIISQICHIKHNHLLQAKLLIHTFLFQVYLADGRVNAPGVRGLLTPQLPHDHGGGHLVPGQGQEDLLLSRGPEIFLTSRHVAGVRLVPVGLRVVEDHHGHTAVQVLQLHEPLALVIPGLEPKLSPPHLVLRVLGRPGLLLVVFL